MVAAREGPPVAVHNDIFVTFEEFLLETLRINHWWAQVDVAWVETSANIVVVPRANFEVNAFEVAFGATLQRHLRVHQILTMHGRGLLALLVRQMRDVFVEPVRSGRQLDMLGVELLAGRYVGKLVLDDCEHLSHRIEDTARELVLVIDGQPAAQHLRNGRLEHL